jgi:hypothetical protein
MPTARKSKTVDLTGWTQREVRLIAFGSWDFDLPQAAMPALNRLLRASHGPERKVISKVDRASLEALARAIRPHVPAMAKLHNDLAPAFEKLERRLAHRGPGPAPNVDEWASRSNSVRLTARALARQLHRSPTDAEVERAMGCRRLTIARWRHRHPELFPADHA